jgi:hypothetical protein
MTKLSATEVATPASACGVRILPDDLDEVTHRLNALLRALAPFNRLKPSDKPLISPSLAEGDA